MPTVAPFWLHCNRCGCLACEKAGDVSKFSITSCGHVFCHECLTERVESCFLCHRSPFRRQTIDATMSSQLQRLFIPPATLLEEAWKKTQSIMAFQRMQFTLSTELLQEKIAASNNHLGNQSEIAQNASELRKEMDCLKSSLANIQRALNRTADISFGEVGPQNGRSGSSDEDVCSIVEMGNISSLNFSFATDANVTARSNVDDPTFDTSAVEEVLNVHTDNNRSVSSVNSMAVVRAKDRKPTVDETTVLSKNGTHPSIVVEGHGQSGPTNMIQKSNANLDKGTANGAFPKFVEQVDKKAISSTKGGLAVVGRDDISVLPKKNRPAFPTSMLNATVPVIAIPSPDVDSTMRRNANARAIRQRTSANVLSVSEFHPLSAARRRVAGLHSLNSSSKRKSGPNNPSSTTVEREHKCATSVVLSSHKSENSSKAASVSVPPESFAASTILEDLALRYFNTHVLPGKSADNLPLASSSMNERHPNISNDETESVAHGWLNIQPIHNRNDLMSTSEAQSTHGHIAQMHHNSKRSHAGRAPYKRHMPSLNMSIACADSNTSTRADASRERIKAKDYKVPAKAIVPASDQSLQSRARQAIVAALTVDCNGTVGVKSIKSKFIPKSRKIVKFHDGLNIAPEPKC